MIAVKKYQYESIFIMRLIPRSYFLDDVLSELDTKRKKRLINFCKKTQTFLTCTEFDYEADKVFVIEDGTLKNK